MEGFISLSSVNLILDIRDYPGHVSKDGPFQSFKGAAVFFVVNVEVSVYLLRVGGVFIDFFFEELIYVGIVYFY